MRTRTSPSTGRRYPLTMICAGYRLPRASVYAALAQPVRPPAETKRGPKTLASDAELVEGIRTVLAPNGNPAHDGTITTDRPDVMWGTDATRFYTEEDGWCWFFGAVDHGIAEVVGWHAAKIGDRWAALAPIRQGVQHAFGAFRKDIARGLMLRCDWGPQYIAQAWISEVKWMGISISPSYVGEPECNGVAERFIRTLKEQCPYLHRFRNVAEARAIIGAFIDRYNSQWLIERLGHRTPAQARADAQAPRAA